MRGDRWLTLFQVGQLLLKHIPRLAELKRPELRQHVRRCVQKAEELNGYRCTKKYRGRVYVSVRALDSLLPKDDQFWGQIERGQAELAQKHRAFERKLNSHGARIRNLERWRKLTTEYIAESAGIK